MALKYFKVIFKNYRAKFIHIYYILGICYFRLKKYHLSESCFLYLLKNGYPERNKVITSLSILYLRTQNYNLHYKYILEAFTSDEEEEKDINVYLYLSEHYFYKGDLGNAEILAKKGLERMKTCEKIEKMENNVAIDNYEIISRFYYVLGFIALKQKTPLGLKKAYKFYSASLKNDKNNYPS